MSHSLRMPITAAVDVACGNAITADVLADAAYPQQSIYGNAEMVRRMSEVSGEPAQLNTSGSLLDASPEEVMAWMMEGIEGFELNTDGVAVDVGLLEVGPDIDAEVLEGLCAAGMDVEAVLHAPDTTSPTTTPAGIAGELYPQQCSSDISESDATQNTVCVDGDRDQYFNDSIRLRLLELIPNVNSALETIKEKLRDKHLTVKDSRKIREQLLEYILSHLSSIIQIALGGVLGGVTSRLTTLAGNAAGPYSKYAVSLLTTEINRRIGEEILSWAELEPSDTISNGQLYDFFESFKNGHASGLCDAAELAQFEGTDAVRAMDVVLEELDRHQKSYISRIRIAALDAFFAAASRATMTARPESDGGDIGTEIYALEVVPCDNPREGIREIKLPEAIPDDLRTEYASQTTLRSRTLLLIEDHWLGDFARAEYHTDTCQVRGIGTSDLCHYRNPEMHELVHAMVPEQAEAFDESVDAGHIPLHQSHHYKTDGPFPQNDSAAVQKVREIGEEAVRRWFLFSINKLGGTDQPLSQLARKVVFL